jgi:hypothetical protein
MQDIQTINKKWTRLIDFAYINMHSIIPKLYFNSTCDQIIKW